MVRIQCFRFGLRGKATGPSIVGRCSGGSELILILWEGSVTRCDRMVMLARGEAPPGKGNGGDDTS
jgi:hypothetical protein